jgi:nitrile hydratase subunit beta
MVYTTYADLGGRPGYGAVTPEPEGVLFHARWEPRAFALTVAMGATGAWNLDMGRAARETLPNYGQLSYYQIWIAGLQKLLEQRGLLKPDEIVAGRSLYPAGPLPRVLLAADVAAVLAQGAPTERPATTSARFGVGQPVRAQAGQVVHHTRLPGYAQGKRGVIERVHGMHVFADARAQGLGEQPQWLYTVVFEGAELWGEAAPAELKVSVDAWEPYLDPV